MLRKLITNLFMGLTLFGIIFLPLVFAILIGLNTLMIRSAN
jgi:hypothetical protein